MLRNIFFQSRSIGRRIDWLFFSEVQIQADKNSSIVKDIQFSPDLNQKYTYTATVTNHESHAIEVSVFPSIAVSTRTSMTYVAETNNLLNKDYDLKKYVKLLPIEGKLERV